MSGPATVGWCPGALRPMLSGDGLILRVKPRGGRLTFDQAEAIASLSTRFGNGHLDLTGRANLQIRGARPDTLDALTDGLRGAGLLDASVAAETLRNIVVSPLAGLDPDSFDIRPFLAKLEEALGGGSPQWGGEARTLEGVPAKWSFVVDGGGRVPLGDVPADMRFRFDAAGRLHVGLHSLWAEPLGRDLDLPRLLGDTAALIAAQPEPMRMKALLARLGPGAVLAGLGLRPATEPTPEVRPVDRTAIFGVSDHLAFAPPFGDLPALLLRDIVGACRAADALDLRLTPWRVLFATGVTDRAWLSARLAPLRLILYPRDPRLSVSACVGAPACHRATAPTRFDAAVLAERLGHDPVGPVHVAGCAKGCARPAETRWALTAGPSGYDLAHAGEAGPRLSGLSSTGAANWLSRAGRERNV